MNVVFPSRAGREQPRRTEAPRAGIRRGLPTQLVSESLVVAFAGGGAPLTNKHSFSTPLMDAVEYRMAFVPVYCN
jgi:hypothetical protein